jgi:hypothetical protein
MPSRKQSGSALRKQSDWQLRILQTAVESRPLRLEHLLNMMWAVAVFSLGGLAVWFGTNGAGWTFQSGFFISLLLISSASALLGIITSSRSNAEFRQKLMLLSRGTPLPQATFEKMLTNGNY